MSYRCAAAVQGAIFARLASEAGVPVFDAMPPGLVPETYVLIGAEEVRDASDRTGAGADHRVTIGVVSQGTGFLAAKELAARLSVAMEDGSFEMEEGRIVQVRFQRAVARRYDGGSMRRIDLTFRIRVET